MALANARVRRMLADYEAPALDPGIAEALHEYVDRRKASEPDAFG
jgi:trimethylamine--corrinoid protein Co-methyltransferase